MRARAYVRSLGLNSGAEWRTYTKGRKKPDDIPAAPWQVYKGNGWTRMGDWLGSGTTAPGSRKYRPFAEARIFVRALGLKSRAHWWSYVESGKKPNDIPAKPDRAYGEQGWTGWGDWLGTDRNRRRTFARREQR